MMDDATTAAKQFTIPCSHCGKQTGFDATEVTGLAAFIATERKSAADYARDDCDDTSELVDDLLQGSRPLRELAMAIRRGDRVEAEYLLDRIADTMGDAAVGEVHEGRYSPLAQETVR